MRGSAAKQKGGSLAGPPFVFRVWKRFNASRTASRSAISASLTVMHKIYNYFNILCEIKIILLRFCYLRCDKLKAYFTLFFLLLIALATEASSSPFATAVRSVWSTAEISPIPFTKIALPSFVRLSARAPYLHCT